MRKWLTEDYKESYKKFSVWFFTLIYLSPDIFQQLVAAGLLDGFLPPDFIMIVKGLAASGIIARIIKQKKKDDENDNNNKTIH